MNLFEIDESWTLFLDRDGVINRRLMGDYVKSLDEFEILPGVLGAIKNFSKKFGRIVIVTNQQGIGKGLMTTEDLNAVHQYFQSKVIENEGRIDAFYHAPNLAAENSDLRKPNIGMAHLAKTDFPEIDFSKSIMVGDSVSDMEFGKNAGMKCVFISEDKKHEIADLCINKLADLPSYLS